ncbi:hypothetical protein [endosymbiont DhMRE of Dentiscutata heterogama]|uniref:hypothetical protein n=1 Tax=endosymbiont DhMRE of Dentiscutata heterogama TaxID=1609546 RepID=UPI002AD29AFB|nr:hypothetical protein [endosymbiont DhMRE of Dentiscutata heterogama]
MTEKIIVGQSKIEGLEKYMVDQPDALKKLENLFNIWKEMAKEYGIAWKKSFIKWDNNPDGVDFSLVMVIPIAHKTKRNAEEVVKEICEKTAERIRKYGNV